MNKRKKKNTAADGGGPYTLLYWVSSPPSTTGEATRDSSWTPFAPANKMSAHAPPLVSQSNKDATARSGTRPLVQGRDCFSSSLVTVDMSTVDRSIVDFSRKYFILKKKDQQIQKSSPNFKKVYQFEEKNIDLEKVYQF